MNAARQFPGERGSQANTAASDAAAAEWVVRCRGDLDAAAQRELAGWRARDPQHEASFQRLSAMSGVLQRARQTGAATAISVELKVRAARRRIRRRALAGAGLAAGLMLVATWGVRVRRSFVTTDQPSAVATIDSIRRLPDGSTIELNRGSEIAVKFEPGFRRVELVRGEALFSVAKDPSRPFIVRAGGVEVRAVGTAFNVRFENAGVEVLVTEGKVRLDDATGKGSLLPRTPDGQPGALVAGQLAVVKTSPSGEARTRQVAAAEIKERLAWRSPRLAYDGIELAQAVDEMNRQNHIRISLEGDALGQRRVSGAFLADDPETFSRLVAETFNLEMEHRGDNGIVLKEPGRATSGR